MVDMLLELRYYVYVLSLKDETDLMFKIKNKYQVYFHICVKRSKREGAYTFEASALT
jgi:hypothetical protein